MRSGGSRARIKAGGALAFVSLLSLALWGATDAGSRASGAPKAGPSAPNFLFVLVDDQATNSFKPRYMPRTFKAIVDPGTNFTNALAAPPLCCPDRAGIITGQYPHNHGVFSNHPGYPELTDPGNTLPVWLHSAGYRTALIGKFLNSYDRTQGDTPAPGFDRWFELLTERRDPYYGFRVSDQGVTRHYGHDRRNYVTDVLTRKATSFLRAQRGRTNPFFLWLPYSAPHVSDLSSG